MRKEGWMQSGKPGGLLEGMLRGDDHEKEQIAGAHPLKPLTDSDMTFDPSLQGASEHRASPRCEHSHRGGGDDSSGKRSRRPGTLTPCKRCNLFCLSGQRFWSVIILVSHCFLKRMELRQGFCATFKINVSTAFAIVLQS